MERREEVITCMVDRQKERDLWVSSHMGDEVMCACFVSLQWGDDDGCM